jgi:hypothetical protein
MRNLLIILFLMVFIAVPAVSIAQDDGNNTQNGTNDTQSTVNNTQDEGNNPPDDNNISNEDFYAPLSPYGNWIQLDNGVTVWHPLHTGRFWAPYKYGHWVWTDDGWYWDSNEPFGYIVYHYGRWYNDAVYGWIWVPDHVWAPAWVEWRYNDNYIGWAPLCPYASFSIGLGIRFTTGFVTPMGYWHFLGYNRMCDPYAYRYYAPDRERARFFAETRYQTNYGYSNGRVMNRGVDVDYIRQRGGGRIVEQHIQRVNDIRNAGGRSNDNIVRAYVPSHQQLAARGNSNVRIQHATKSSSLDVTKVNISSRINNNQPQNKIQNTSAARVNNENKKPVNNSQPKVKNNPQPRVKNTVQKGKRSGENKGGRNDNGGGRR